MLFNDEEDDGEGQKSALERPDTLGRAGTDHSNDVVAEGSDGTDRNPESSNQGYGTPSLGERDHHSNC